MRREKRTETIALRVGPQVKAEIQTIAEREHRTVSQQVYKWVLEGLEAVRKHDERKGRKT